jgi:serine/threonine-protein kinase
VTAPAFLTTDQLRFELLRPIAQGGMGMVFEAMQHGLDGFRKRVALKIIRDEYASMPLFRRNFVGEARLVADLVHANIVQIYHLTSTDKNYVMVMEFVDGRNLEQFCLQHRALERPVPCKIAAFITSRIARALAHAHRQTDDNGRLLGIVHRDVSPRNVMISFCGDVKLTDFGIAKAYNLMYGKEGDIVAGRSEYISPEQTRREVTDYRADLFSCGVILLELLLGENPFLCDSPNGSRYRIRTWDPPPLPSLRADICPQLEKIVRRALHKDRELRYQNAAVLMNDLETYLYSNEFGPTMEKMGLYMRDLYADGDAYDDDIEDFSDPYGLMARF